MNSINITFFYQISYKKVGNCDEEKKMNSCNVMLFIIIDYIRNFMSAV